MRSPSRVRPSIAPLETHHPDGQQSCCPCRLALFGAATLSCEAPFQAAIMQSRPGPPLRLGRSCASGSIAAGVVRLPWAVLSGNAIAGDEHRRGDAFNRSPGCRPAPDFCLAKLACSLMGSSARIVTETCVELLVSLIRIPPIFLFRVPGGPSSNGEFSCGSSRQ
jgi:hypothetical protein